LKTAKASLRPAHDRATAIVGELKRLGSKEVREQIGPRFGIHTTKAFGVGVIELRRIAKRTGHDHELAAALWKTGWHEARMLAALLDDPARVTPAQMDRWCRDFDNWAICDTACFHLFDRTPHAFAQIEQWSSARAEFVRRAAFALLASVALHDKRATNEQFTRCFPLIEAAANDERNFVKKAVSWALRAIGKRNPPLHAAALAVAQRLAASTQPTERWIGKDVCRDLATGATTRRLARRSSNLAA
jgi:3-methyladenine DNA glycosylase AlkD